MSLTFKAGFEQSGHEAHIINYHDFTGKLLPGLDHYGNMLPAGFRNHIRNTFLEKIQSGYLSAIGILQPDLVISYNDQMVTGETVTRIQEMGARYAVYLADSPFFLQRRNHLFNILSHADHIFAPDSYWLHQLNILGITKTTFLVIGYDENIFYTAEPTPEEMAAFGTEIVYMGSAYNSIWGYKRALFLKQFTGMNFRFYGPPAWKMWFKEFPELQDHFILNRNRLTDGQVNTISNCCKLYPVDANPGLINGLHVRIFDCLGSGILPLVEYRSDLDRVFDGLEIPVIKDYRKGRELAGYYLKNETARKETLTIMRNHLVAQYTPGKAAQTIIKASYS